MREYLNIVRDVLDNGVLKPNRTGVDTIAGFSYNFRHDLADGFPLLTTKKMDGPLWNSLVHELLWFLSGENHIRNLQKHTGIWDEWADEEGNLETAYGFFWRNFPSADEGRMRIYPQPSGYSLEEPHPIASARNVDQVAWIIDQLKTNPNSRRLVCSAWEPANAQRSKLPPCHFAWVVNVQGNRLNLQWIQRSCDLGLGVPFNIASYALLCHVLAQETNLEPGILAGLLIDAHVYCADKGIDKEEFDHVGPLKQQLRRDPLPLCQIKIARKPMADLAFEDFELVGYNSHERIRMRVAP